MAHWDSVLLCRVHQPRYKPDPSHTEENLGAVMVSLLSPSLCFSVSKFKKMGGRKERKKKRNKSEL